MSSSFASEALLFHRGWSTFLGQWAFLCSVCHASFMEGWVSSLPVDFSCHHPLSGPEVSAGKMASWASSTHWFECFQEEFRWFDILIYGLLSHSGVNSFWLMKTNLWKPSEAFSQRRYLLQSWGIWKCEECGFSCHNDWWDSVVKCPGTRMLPILQSKLWLCIMKSCSVENVIIALLRKAALWKEGGVGHKPGNPEVSLSLSILRVGSH